MTSSSQTLVYIYHGVASHISFQVANKQTYITWIETSQGWFKHHIIKSKAWHTFLHIMFHQNKIKVISQTNAYSYECMTYLPYFTASQHLYINAWSYECMFMVYQRFRVLCQFKEFLDKWREGFEGLGYCDHIKQLALGSVLRVTVLWDSGSCGFRLLRCGSNNLGIISQRRHCHRSRCGVSIMVVKRYENTQNIYIYIFWANPKHVLLKHYTVIF